MHKPPAPKRKSGAARNGKGKRGKQGPLRAPKNTDGTRGQDCPRVALPVSVPVAAGASLLDAAVDFVLTRPVADGIVARACFVYDMASKGKLLENMPEMPPLESEANSAREFLGCLPASVFPAAVARLEIVWETMRSNNDACAMQNTVRYMCTHGTPHYALAIALQLDPSGVSLTPVLRHDLSKVLFAKAFAARSKDRASGIRCASGTYHVTGI
jgi:hypothetical protein